MNALYREGGKTLPNRPVNDPRSGREFVGGKEPALCRVSGFMSADEALRHRSVVVPTASKS